MPGHPPASHLPQTRPVHEGEAAGARRRHHRKAVRHAGTSYRLAAVVLGLSLWLSTLPALGQSANPVRSIPIAAFDDIVGQSENCLVVVMAAWCHPCIQELPHLNALDRKYRPQGLKTVGISLDYAGPEAMQPIIDDLKVGFPIYWTGEAAIEKYAITKIPLLLFVRKGRILRRVQGGRDIAAIEKEIMAFLETP
jgi:thiol-disulfide isomerase/thioredoxin